MHSHESVRIQDTHWLTESERKKRSGQLCTGIILLLHIKAHQEITTTHTFTKFTPHNFHRQF